MKQRSGVFKKELGLFDLVLTQIVFVVGTIWVGWAAKLGDHQMVFWLLAIVTFYLPLAAVVIFLNRLMPLEGGVYQWAKLAFNDFVAFMVAWNLWIFGILVMSGIGLIIKKNITYAIGPRADWMHENKLMTTVICTLLDGHDDRGVAARLDARQVGAEFRRRVFAGNVCDSDPAAVHYRRPRHARKLSSVFDQLSGVQQHTTSTSSANSRWARFQALNTSPFSPVSVARRRETSVAQS